MQRALVLGAGEVAASLAAHLRAAEVLVAEAPAFAAAPAGPFDLLVSALPASAAEARAEIEAFASGAPKARRDGADLRPGAQVIVLFERPALAALSASMEAAATEALIRHAALTLAPDLRVNAITLGAVRPTHPAHYAAWQAHQSASDAPAGKFALFELFDYLRTAESVTGQTLILNA